MVNILCLLSFFCPKPLNCRMPLIPCSPEDQTCFCELAPASGTQSLNRDDPASHKVRGKHITDFSQQLQYFRNLVTSDVV